jgi:hypothetical protein
MRDHARGHRLRTGVIVSLIAMWCNNRGGKATGPCRRGKKVQ